MTQKFNIRLLPFWLVPVVASLILLGSVHTADAQVGGGPGGGGADGGAGDGDGGQVPPVCLLYTSPSPRDRQKSRMPSSA